MKSKKLISLTLVMLMVFSVSGKVHGTGISLQADTIIYQMMFEEKNFRYNEIIGRLTNQGINLTQDQVKHKMIDIANQNGSEIISQNKGFVTIASMLPKRLSDITFVGPHNAFANNSDGTNYNYPLTLDQTLGMKQLLDKGSRILDLDICLITDFHPVEHYHKQYSMGRTNISKSISATRDFLNENPNDIVILNISEYIAVTAPVRRDDGDDSDLILNKYLTKLDQAGLLDHTINYDSSLVTTGKYQGLRTYLTGPQLIDMLGKDKRILILARQYNVELAGMHAIKGSPFDYTPEYHINNTTIDHHDTILFENFPDNKAAADPLNAQYSNEGRRLYEMISEINDGISVGHNGRSIDLVTLDYMLGNKNQGGVHDVSPVDAINRLNIEATGHAFSEYADEDFYWKDHYNGETGRVTDQITALTVETSNTGILNQTQTSKLTDGKVLTYLKKNNDSDGFKYNNFKMTFNLQSSQSLKYIGLHMNDRAMKELTGNDFEYTLKGIHNGTKTTIKNGLVHFHRGEPWYNLDLGSNNTAYSSYELTFNAGQNLRLAEIELYNNEATQKSTIAADRGYFILNRNSYRVASVSESNLPNNNANVFQYDGNKNVGKLWKFEHISGNTYIIRNRASGKVLSLGSGGGTVRQRDESTVQEANRYKWLVVDIGTTENGYLRVYRITNVHNNKNLVVNDRSRYNGADITTYSQGSHRNQTWLIVEKQY